jgi:hypothetical protein
MKHFENYSSFTKNKDYKLISGHNRILKKLNLDSSILGVKTIPIVGIYKIFKNLTSHIELSEEFMMLIIIYILLYKLNINLELSKKLRVELEAEIPNFQVLVKKFSLSLHTIIVIANIVFKKDTLVIDGFEKLLRVKIILKVLNLISDFIIEHTMNLDDFSYIVYDKDRKVLKNIVEFVDKETSKDRYYIEGLLLNEKVTDLRQEKLKRLYRNGIDKESMKML